MARGEKEDAKKDKSKGKKSSGKKGGSKSAVTLEQAVACATEMNEKLELEPAISIEDRKLKDIVTDIKREATGDGKAEDAVTEEDGLSKESWATLAALKIVEQKETKKPKKAAGEKKEKKGKGIASCKTFDELKAFLATVNDDSPLTLRIDAKSLEKNNPKEFNAWAKGIGHPSATGHLKYREPQGFMYETKGEGEKATIQLVDLQRPSK